MYMKVCFRYNKSQLDDTQVEVLQEFCRFLQTQNPLRKPLVINFTTDRVGQMTTGVRMPHSKIFVLTDGRMLIDIMRTLSHEWVHEFQHQKLNVKEFQKTQDIGGPHENMANTLSGIFMKKFQKKMPQYVKVMYQK